MSGIEPEIEQVLHEKLCAYVLGELDEFETAQVEAELERNPALRAERARLEATLGLVRDALPEERLSEEVQAVLQAAAERGPERRRFTFLRGGGGLVRLAAAALLLIFGGFFAFEVLFVDALHRELELPSEEVARGPVARLAAEPVQPVNSPREIPADELRERFEALGYSGGASKPVSVTGTAGKERSRGAAGPAQSGPQSPGPPAPGAQGTKNLIVKREHKFDPQEHSPADRETLDAYLREQAAALGVDNRASEPTLSSALAAAKSESLVDGRSGERTASGKGDALLALSRLDVSEEGQGARAADEPEALAKLGYLDDDEQKESDSDGFFLGRLPREPVDVPQAAPLAKDDAARIAEELIESCRIRPGETPAAMFFRCWGDNPEVVTAEDALSTFSIDVDTASYTLARRMLNEGYFPTKEQVRTEEFVNYFRADRPAPAPGDVFAIGLEAAPSLFHPDPRVEMLRVTVRGEDIDAFERQPLALTFVIDVSGSMETGDRLGQVKNALGLLLRQLSTSDSIAVVAFNREARVVSEMVSAARRGEIEDAVQALVPEGGTNVEAGLITGFDLAARALTPHAVNRIVLLSDGVGNIGETDQARLLAKVAEHRALGIYLNTIGFGLENHHDEFLEQLADRGDGLCQYVDSPAEAKRILVDGFTKTLQPIARDVKIQVEFAPDQVERYRLLGYENRAIADERFRDDAVDAGEVNAGHQVTALYEITRAAGSTGSSGGVQPLATVRVRYKPPFPVDRGDESARAKAAAEKAVEISAAIRPGDLAPSFEAASAGYRRSVLVAQFAELLRRSVHARGDSLETLVEKTRRLAAELDDPEVTEFLGLVERALPRLEELEARRGDELDQLVDELCRLHYEKGRRAAEGEGAQSEASEESQADASESEPRQDHAAEVERIEERIRELVQERTARRVR